MKTMIDEFADLLPHDEACFTLGLIAEHLNIEIPTDPKMVRFFLTRITNTVITNQKQAKAGNVLVDALKQAVNGR